MQFWKIALIGGGLTLAGCLGWFYSSKKTATLVALNTHTGKLAWLHPLSEATNRYSRGPIASDGKVLFESIQIENGKKQTGNSRPFYQLQALDAKSGQLIWTYHPPNNDYTAFDVESFQSVVFQANQLYLQFGDELLSLDPATGQQHWVIKRPWSSANVLSIGVAVLPQFVSVIAETKGTRSLQFIDPKTGKIQRQTNISLDPLTSTRDLIAADERSIFLETAGLIQTGKESYHSSGRATITAYDIKSGAVRFQTEIPVSEGISKFKSGSNGLQIRSYGYYDAKQGKYLGGLTLLAIDSGSGRILWRKSYQQISCPNDRQSWQVDADSIYLNCGKESGLAPNTIVALSTQTGNVKWRTQISLADNFSTRYINSAVSAQQFLTFRKIKSGQSVQTQAIALDRQSGKLLWSYPLTSERYVNKFGQVVATEGDRFFFFDLIPRWRIWLCQIGLALR